MRAAEPAARSLALLLLVGCAPSVPGKALDADVTPDQSDPEDDAAATPVPDEEVEGVGGRPSVDDAVLEDFFAYDQVREISIEIDTSDWDELRFQTRSMFDLLGGDCMATAAVSPFTYFPATIEVDGERVENVGLRKKGFIGSLSTTRPGLKVDMDQYVDDQRFLGLEKLVLNNTPQDPTMLRTCFAYAYFRDVGVPAPRCGFAHITVNGEDMGIYANVEAPDDHWLDRQFGDPDTPLFEGTLSDLQDGWLNTYDLDSDGADLSQLEPLKDAVASGDYDQLDAVINLEAFARFWVAEGLLAHWDGYGWNQNNHFIALDPADGRARFLPWGPDATLSSWSPGGGVDWMPLTAELPRALARTERGEALFKAEAERQLAEVWDEDALLDRLYTMEDAIAPWHRAVGQVGEMAEILRWRDGDLADGIAGRWPRIPSTPRDAFCMEEIGTLDFAFSTQWGSTTGAAAGGSCTGAFTWYGDRIELEPGGAYAGRDGETDLLYCWHGYGTAELLSYITMPAGELQPGTIPIEHTVHRLGFYYSEGGGNWQSVSWVEGELVMDAADTTTGGAVEGSFSGTLWEPAW
jgi:hypothetical protein